MWKLPLLPKIEGHLQINHDLYANAVMPHDFVPKQISKSLITSESSELLEFMRHNDCMWVSADLSRVYSLNRTTYDPLQEQFPEFLRKESFNPSKLLSPNFDANKYY